MAGFARRVVIAAFSVLLYALAAPSAALAALATPIGDESKYASIVVDATTGEVLYAKRADSPRYPASVTKVMTLYLTFEAMSQGKLRADEYISVSRHAASQSPTKLGVPAGSSIAVDDAIRSLTTKSANDMAVALAERIGGTESRFAALMTLKAQELGMYNSRFVNANGLPDSRQISTARDLAVLSRAMIRDFPQYYGYFSQKQFTYRGQVMNNHNRLLFDMPGVDGLKTGFTNASGYNLAATAVRNGHRLIGVVLGGSSGGARDRHMRELLETGFDVMRRRDAGETILVAQNIFESQGAAPAYQQNDEAARIEVADQSFGGLPAAPHMQVAAAPHAPLPQMQPNGVMSFAPQAYAAVASRPVPNPPEWELEVEAPAPVKAPPAKAAAKTKKKPLGEYVVQVGAFKTQQDARSQLKKIERGFAKHFDDAEAIVGSRVNGFFRSQFTGLTESSARAACSALKAKRMPCLIIAP